MTDPTDENDIARLAAADVVDALFQGDVERAVAVGTAALGPYGFSSEDLKPTDDLAVTVARTRADDQEMVRRALERGDE